MKRMIFMCLAVAGCAGAGDQTALTFVAINNAAAAKPLPSGFIAGTQFSAKGQFQVTLGSGQVLNGSYTNTTPPGPLMPEGGPVLDPVDASTAQTSASASNGATTLQCAGTWTAAALNLNCDLSDGSSYQVTE